MLLLFIQHIRNRILFPISRRKWLFNSMAIGKAFRGVTSRDREHITAHRDKWAVSLSGLGFFVSKQSTAANRAST